MTTWDRLLIITVLAAAAASFFVVGAALGAGAQGKHVIVKVDGVITDRFSLDEPTTVTIRGRSGTCRLRIDGGSARIIDSDCPNGLCMAGGSIEETGQSIVCLPHRIVVEATAPARESGGVDAVVR